MFSCTGPGLDSTRLGSAPLDSPFEQDVRLYPCPRYRIVRYKLCFQLTMINRLASRFECTLDSGFLCPAMSFENISSLDCDSRNLKYLIEYDCNVSNLGLNLAIWRETGNEMDGYYLDRIFSFFFLFFSAEKYLIVLR